MNGTPEHTPAYKIFHYYIECMIPASFAYESQQAMLGTTQYESPDKEESASKEMVSRQHTVAELIEYHRRGATIILRNPDDAIKIYGWLRDHLAEARHRVQFGVNVGNLPMDDLHDMDEFATMVYRIARNYERVDERQSLMGRKLDDMFSRRLLRRRRPSEEDMQSAEERPAKEHASIIEDISTTAIERGLKFK